MINIIDTWTYDKPEETGHYLACRGDVSVWANCEYVVVTMDANGNLVDQDDEFVSDYHSSYKFATLVLQ